MLGKNTLINVRVKTAAWKNGTLAIHAVALVGVESPIAGAKPLKLKVYTGGSLGVSVMASAEHKKAEVAAQLSDLKHYLSLLNVDLTEFDKILGSLIL